MPPSGKRRERGGRAKFFRDPCTEREEEGGRRRCLRESVRIPYTRKRGERKHIRLCMLRGGAFFLSPQMPPPPPPLPILASPPPAGGFPSSHLVAVYASDFLLIRRRFPAQKKRPGKKVTSLRGVASPWMFDLKGQRSKRLSPPPPFFYISTKPILHFPQGREGASRAQSSAGGGG